MNFPFFSDRILEDINPQMTFPNSGDERYFCKETNKILNQKRKKENERARAPADKKYAKKVLTLSFRCGIKIKPLYEGKTRKAFRSPVRRSPRPASF